MNIQKIPMRPVICLLLVVLLNSTVFSVSVFADEVVQAVEVESYSSELVLLCLKSYVPEVTPEDVDLLCDFYYFAFEYAFYSERSGTLFVSEGDIYVLFDTWNEHFTDKYPESYLDFDEIISSSTYYLDHGVIYLPFSCTQDMVILGSYEISLTPFSNSETEPTVPAVSDSTLSQAVSASSISAVLDQVLDLLPVVVGCIVGFVAIRKGLSFLESILHSA